MKRPRAILSISIDASLSSTVDTIAAKHGMTRSRVIELALGLCISHAGGFQKLVTDALLAHDFNAMLSGSDVTADARVELERKAARSSKRTKPTLTDAKPKPRARRVKAVAS